MHPRLWADDEAHTGPLPVAAAWLHMTQIKCPVLTHLPTALKSLSLHSPQSRGAKSFSRGFFTCASTWEVGAGSPRAETLAPERRRVQAHRLPLSASRWPASLCRWRGPSFLTALPILDSAQPRHFCQPSREKMLSRLSWLICISWTSTGLCPFCPQQPLSELQQEKGAHPGFHNAFCKCGFTAFLWRSCSRVRGGKVTQYH